ncbi:fatty acid amide hydrolase-like isoform X1 [Lytechinus variegatus]|uniref:fatty acid amide hydrolase-like isoform X1 n=1 Tax=Lytechinus variegatus TaxID=7654 RepID=UPI001BB2C1C2|nr:fatty acid amide hydrolase-like isoform X1 [Lytechinus variegatus]
MKIMGYLPSLCGIFSGAFVIWLLFIKRATKPGKLIKRRRLTPESYDYNMVRANIPLRASGNLLRFVLHLSNTWIGRLILNPKTKRKSHFNLLHNFVIEDPPTYEPVVPTTEPSEASDPLKIDLDYLIQPERKESKDFRFKTVSDYYHAYRSGKVTPEDVAECVMEDLEKTEQMKPRMRMLAEYDVEEVYKMAKESTIRINNKKPLSIFDGVPVVIKEELAVKPYHLRSGTTFLGRDPVKEDSTIAAKLRAGGAVIIGISNMHEVGLGVIGMNISASGTARNPYNPNHYPGGSSSGSGACVASGLCPLAIGTDGGGSVRIPSALCGIVGLKPTYGRWSRHGSMPLCRTVSVAGPMTTCVQDTAMLLEYLAGEDPEDSATWHQPTLKINDLQTKSLSGLKIGIDWKHFRDANAEIVAECEKAVIYLEKQGAELVAINIPECEEMRMAHALLISTEMYSFLQEAYRDNFHDFVGDTALVLTMASSANAVEYINANKQRTRTMHYLKQLFKQVDVIVCPGCGVTAPRIQPGDLEYGVNDTAMTIDVMRFSPLANISGIPGLVVPVGYDAKNLPISLQIMGPWWEEGRLLRVGAVAERMLARKHQPQVYFDVLKEAMSSP